MCIRDSSGGTGARCHRAKRRRVGTRHGRSGQHAGVARPWCCHRPGRDRLRARGSVTAVVARLHGLAAAALDVRVDERETLAVRTKIQRCDVVAVQPLMGSAMAR